MLSLFLLCVSVVRQQQGQAGRRPECVIVDAGDQLIKMERSRANHSVSREQNVIKRDQLQAPVAIV